ncbi:MAG: hypothetical protein K6F84_06105, partial [Lachnospiraceae bacterium]|nr:hypothetical protein [Lachnospiraceae bacterium]
MSTERLYYGFKQEENISGTRYDDTVHCAVVGVLMFMASFGAITGILTEFDIEANYVGIGVILFAASMFLAMIHVSRLVYNTGYIAFFFLFTYNILINSTYVNSGYQAMLNILNKAYSAFFALSGVREYNEIVKDRYLTITYMAVFVGLFLVLLLNVGVFNEMLFFTTFNLTFWPLQLGIFIGKYPSFFSIFLLICSYLGVYFLRHSNHYFFVKPAKKKKPREPYFEYSDKNDENVVWYKSGNRAMVHLLIFVIILSGVVALFCSQVVKTSEEEALVKVSSAKANMNEKVEIITQNGIMGMFNRYRSKGGLSSGRLGGVRGISPDNETDLEVTYVPFSLQTLYLKGFVGQEYKTDRWNAPTLSTNYTSTEDESLSGKEERYFLESRTVQNMMDVKALPEAYARIKVENVDASTAYPLAPYYTCVMPDNTMVTPYSILSGTSAWGETRTYEFVPDSTSLYRNLMSAPVDLKKYVSSQDTTCEEIYRKEVYANYLQIPDDVKDELMKFHSEIGKGNTVGEQVALIYRYFLDNYQYNLMPGATPRNKDFVVYFLTSQKRGYCA